jgi:hypothetical protein
MHPSFQRYVDLIVIAVTNVGQTFMLTSTSNMQPSASVAFGPSIWLLDCSTTLVVQPRTFLVEVLAASKFEQLREDSNSFKRASYPFLAESQDEIDFPNDLCSCFSHLAFLFCPCYLKSGSFHVAVELVLNFECSFVAGRAFEVGELMGSLQWQERYHTDQGPISH